MRIDNQRRSDNFQDRGRGVGGGGAIPAGALIALVSRLGIRGVLLIGLLLLAVYFFMPGMRAPLLGMLGLGGGSAESSGQVCDQHGQACDFSRAVLGSTEDVWRAQFQQGRVPSYGTQPGAYRDPSLHVFADSVSTGCGTAPSSVGPFYCPADGNLYIDPSFYQTMQTRLNAPGDFAQAYVIAHEVGHHVQNLIGATRHSVPGETQNQTSVRVELQADCFAGVWGHTARSNLAIDDADLREALTAAHAIGDDALGARQDQYTHGTSAQRMRWFRRGFDSGDARQCDSFAVPNYGQL
ncbi:MAG TPA: neutral zinc metallopeptidase [Vitreimonas sp.]|nr:neutral zinc metallopeptidase [Vitreimonas sp.]